MDGSAPPTRFLREEWDAEFPAAPSRQNLDTGGISGSSKERRKFCSQNMVAHRVAATAASLMAAACVAAVVILAADGRPGTEEPLPATALAQEETARRLETAGLGGIFRRRSRSTAQREQPRQRTMAPAGLAVAAAGLRSVGNPPCQPWRRHRPHRAALGRPRPWSAFGCHPRGVCVLRAGTARTRRR